MDNGNMARMKYRSEVGVPGQMIVGTQAPAPGDRMFVSLLENSFLFAKEHPAIFRSYLRCFHPKSLAHLPGQDTDLLIAGYQRSGNTYATKMMHKIDLALRISSHAHAVAELKIAKSRRIPSIVMIREPEEAIASSVVKHRDRSFRRHANFHVLEYVRYYSYVLRERESFFVLTFANATENPECFLQLHRHFFPNRPTSLTPERTFQAVRENALHKVKNNFYQESASHQSTWTNEEKQRLKKESLGEIHLSPHFAEALSLHAELLLWADRCRARIPSEVM